MGLFSEIKKLFFAQRSVAKSAANKAKDQGEEIIDSAREKGSELYQKSKAKAEQLKDKVEDKWDQIEDKAEARMDQLEDKAEVWKEKAKVSLDKLEDKADALKDKAEDKLGKLMDAFDVEDDDDDTPAPPPVDKNTGLADDAVERTTLTPTPPDRSIPRDKTFVEKLGEKTLHKAEELGEKTLEGMDKLGDKLEDLAEDVGEKAIKAKDDLVEKAKEVAADLDRKLDETVVKAKKLDEELSANDQDKDGYADTGMDLGKSTLEGQDDFFSKAERFAKGEPLEDRPDVEITQGKPQPKKDIKAAGFEDLDGDGDEIIDDAIIED
jgi:E3 ubiquitin-protein ligase HUWE1